MQNSISVQTSSGTTETIHVVTDFSQFVEVGQFGCVMSNIRRVIESAADPTSKELIRLVAYGNKVVDEYNARYSPKFEHFKIAVTTVTTKVSTASYAPSQDDDLELSLAMALSLGDLEVKEETKTVVTFTGPKGLFRTTSEVIHQSLWKITRYADGTSTVNGTFVCPVSEPIDRTNGGIVGEAPYCFLIAVYHDNLETMERLKIKSPFDLLSKLIAAKGLLAPNKMFERTTILPVAKLLNATIQVTLQEGPMGHDDGIIGDGPNLLFVRLHSLTKRHYISGTE